MTEEQKMFMQLLEDECVINTNDIVEYPPVAISMGETTTCYHDFAAIVDEIDKISINPKSGEIQFFNPTK